MQSGKLIDFLKVCKCGMLCVNFLSVAVYKSATMEFWPLLLEERIKRFFRFIFAIANAILKTRRFLKSLQLWHVVYEPSFCRSV